MIGVQPVAELRREHAVDRLFVLAFAQSPAEADRGLGHVRGAGVRGHDQDHVAEVDDLAVVVGHLPVVHDLQQDVEEVRMGLFDLVQQHDAVGMLVDRVGQETALIEADVARRRADQAADRMALHVLRHVEADQLDAHGAGKLAGDLGLADAGRAREDVGADRLFRLAQAGARQLDGIGQRVDRLVLAEHHGLEVAAQVLQGRAVVLRDALGRDPGDLGDHRLDLLDPDRLAPLGLGHQHLGGADLVDHVDRLVRQLAVVDVARRQLDRRTQGLGGVAHPMVLLIVRLEAA